MGIIAVGKSLSLIGLSVLLGTFGSGWSGAQASEDGSALSAPIEARKVTLGAVEDVVLSPWGIRFPARIDTGADLSSLDAREIVVENDIAEFKLGSRFGGQRLRIPVLEWRRIQTATGTERRPVVEVSICLGSKLFRTPVTLKDRSEMLYPFLVGRSALSGSFLVDPSRSNAAQPACVSASGAGSDLMPKAG